MVDLQWETRIPTCGYLGTLSWYVRKTHPSLGKFLLWTPSRSWIFNKNTLPYTLGLPVQGTRRFYTPPQPVLCPDKIKEDSFLWSRSRDLRVPIPVLTTVQTTRILLVHLPRFWSLGVSGPEFRIEITTERVGNWRNSEVKGDLFRLWSCGRNVPSITLP